jgi:hypothetical protein
MVDQEKQALLKQLDESRTRALCLLKTIAADKVIYPEGNWKLTDVINHLMVWEEISLVSLKAFVEDKEGPVVAEAIFNQHTVAERRYWSAEKVLNAWQAIRDQLKTAIQAMPEEIWRATFVFPWGDRGTLAQMVRGLIEHEDDHLRDVLKTAGSGPAPEPA